MSFVEILIYKNQSLQDGKDTEYLTAQPIESNGLVEFKVKACQKLKTCKYGYTNTEASKSHCHKTNLILQ